MLCEKLFAVCCQLSYLSFTGLYSDKKQDIRVQRTSQYEFFAGSPCLRESFPISCLQEPVSKRQVSTFQPAGAQLLLFFECVDAPTGNQRVFTSRLQSDAPISQLEARPHELPVSSR